MVGSRDRRRNERILWAFRALADGRFEMAESLVANLGPLGGEREIQRQESTVKAAARAGTGKLEAADRALRTALKVANTDEDAATARLQVVYALLRQDPPSEEGLEWAAELMTEARTLLGPEDDDIRFLDDLRVGKPHLKDRFEAAEMLSADPRSGRFHARGLRRGGPGSSRLIPADGYGPVNVSASGRPTSLFGFEWTPGGTAAPFGPTFHPVDHTPLPYFFHPGR